jgi:hypothetical protein
MGEHHTALASGGQRKHWRSVIQKAGFRRTEEVRLMETLSEAFGAFFGRSLALAEMNETFPY